MKFTVPDTETVNFSELVFCSFIARGSVSRPRRPLYPENAAHPAIGIGEQRQVRRRQCKRRKQGQQQCQKRQRKHPGYAAAPLINFSARDLSQQHCQEKQQHIRRAAEYYLYKNRVSEAMPCRFDVVAILGDRITLIRDAF